MTRCYWLLCVAVLSSRICCGSSSSSSSSSGSEGASQVITLTDESFQEKVMKKSKLQDKTDNELWLIEFYAVRKILGTLSIMTAIPCLLNSKMGECIALVSTENEAAYCRYIPEKRAWEIY